MRSVVSTPNGWALVGFHRPYHPTRVRVRLALAGLCRTDIQAMAKQYPLPDGTVLGHEAAGTVEHIPSHLVQQARERGIEVGSRVAFYPFYPCGRCPSCHSHMGMEFCHSPTIVGMNEPGAFASFIDVPLEVMVAGPNTLSWRHLAYAEPVAASMAVATLPQLQDGTVAVVGQGRIATLTATVLSAARNAPVAILPPDTDIEGTYDALVETWPSERTLQACAKALKVGGTLVVKSRPPHAVPWPHKLVALKRLQVVGAPYGSFAQGVEWMASGKLKVDHMLGDVFPLTDEGIAQALETERNGQETHGKLFFDCSV